MQSEFPIAAKNYLATLLYFCICLTGLANAREIPDTHPPASSPVIAQQSNAFPVIFSGTEIFIVMSSPIPSLSPEARANLIRGNIQEFADRKTAPSSLKITPLKEGYAIGDENSTLMIVSQQDIMLSGKSDISLTEDTLNRMKQAISNYQDQRSWRVYGTGTALSLLSIVVLWLALFWNNRIFKWLQDRIFSKYRFWSSGLRFQEVEILSDRRLDDLLHALLNMLRLAVILLSLYFILPLILSFFPETRELSSTIFGYLITPFKSVLKALLGFIPDLFYILVIIVIAHYVLKIISYIFNLIDQEEIVLDWFYRDWAIPTYQIIRFLIIVTALISAYPYIPGSSSSAFQGVGLVLGAILSFASSSAISNIVAGIILTYTRAFRLNDRIMIGETTGDVVEKTLLVTRIKTIKHVVVTIPNSIVMNSQIVNYSTSAAESDGIILHTSITIGYDIQRQTVETLLLEAAKATELILTTPEPFVLHASLDDFSIRYELNAYTKHPEKMAMLYSALHRNILDQFNTAGVEILSPQYHAIRDGNTPALPATSS